MIQKAITSAGGSTIPVRYMVSGSSNSNYGVLNGNDWDVLARWVYTATGQQYNDDNITVTHSGAGSNIVSILVKKACKIEPADSSGVETSVSANTTLSYILSATQLPIAIKFDS